ncbi:MAG: hypothetical protein AAGJ37_06305 [Pseudomonadota bacterium]
MSFPNNGRTIVLAAYVFAVTFHGFSTYAAPGSHGSDGEHLTTDSTITVQSNPRFEAFTEAFEVVGELSEDELVIYLHDYATNEPVGDASIEVEVDELSAMADFNGSSNYYSLSTKDVLSRISQPGEHHIILTIFSEDAADLLALTIMIQEQNVLEEEHDDHHHHFPWWSILGGLITLSIGVFFGRLSVRSVA